MMRMEERIQKLLAQAGFGSRRACEDYIKAGRVRVNGTVAELGQKADPAADKITLDGRPVAVEQKVYIALHKPRNVLSTVEKEQGDTRKTVRDLVPVPERVYPVGRLDFESEGLIFMTNDGTLAQELSHPSKGHAKVYRVLVARHPDQEQLETWRRGVVLEDGHKTMPAEVYVESASGKGAWLRVTMQEGRKRQIRETCALLGLPVVRIVRISIGALQLGRLKKGEWRYLTPEEVDSLKSGQKPSRRSTPPRRSSRTPRPAPAKKARSGPRKPPSSPARAGSRKPPAKR